jgi:DNA-directed RNA polymerase specialized sigma24 family protein
MTDFSHIPARHEAIDQRLTEWARWVRVKPQQWACQPMFRQYRAPRQYEHQATVHIQINTIEAHEIEKAVGNLPMKHRDAIRWFYVFNKNPLGMARSLAVSTDGLLDLVTDGRDMLKNRLSKVEISCKMAQSLATA